MLIINTVEKRIQWRLEGHLGYFSLGGQEDCSEEAALGAVN